MSRTMCSVSTKPNLQVLSWEPEWKTYVHPCDRLQYSDFNYNRTNFDRNNREVDCLVTGLIH